LSPPGVEAGAGEGAEAYQAIRALRPLLQALPLDTLQQGGRLTLGERGGRDPQAAAATAAFESLTFGQGLDEVCRP
jgi:hypothetical protein